MRTATQAKHDVLVLRNHSGLSSKADYTKAETKPQTSSVQGRSSQGNVRLLEVRGFRPESKKGEVKGHFPYQKVRAKSDLIENKFQGPKLPQ